MSQNHRGIGLATLNRVSARASKFACTAAFVALVPLAIGVMPGTAHATLSDSFTFTAGTGPNGENTYLYALSLDTGSVTTIEIPEFQPGLFDLTYSSLPPDWGANEVLSPSLTGESTALGGPGAYIDITGGTLSSGAPVDFTLYSFSAPVDATIAASDGTTTLNADGATPAPEPASITVLGGALAGLVGLRRRKQGLRLMRAAASA
jgi:hypothetical protein